MQSITQATFFIYHSTADGRGVAPFMPAFSRQHQTLESKMLLTIFSFCLTSVSLSALALFLNNKKGIWPAKIRTTYLQISVSEHAKTENQGENDRKRSIR